MRSLRRNIYSLFLQIEASLLFARKWTSSRNYFSNEALSREKKICNRVRSRPKTGQPHICRVDQRGQLSKLPDEDNETLGISASVVSYYKKVRLQINEGRHVNGVDWTALQFIDQTWPR